MNIEILSKEDLWCAILGGAALGTGGGGSAISRQVFDSRVDTLIGKGLKFRMISPEEIPGGEQIFLNMGVGGGITRIMQERCLRGFGVSDWIKEIDKVNPLPNWAEIPDEKWRDVSSRRLVELIGSEPFGYIPFEIGPNIISEMLPAAIEGKLIINADIAGYRCVPDISLTTLNVIHAPIVPLTVSTSWGDLMVFEKFLSWQRAEDLVRHIAITSGGGCEGWSSFKDDLIKEGSVNGTVSLAIKLGRLISEAREKGDNPISKIVEATSGYNLFEGKIGGYTNEGHGAFVWGNAWIKGTGDYKGHTLKVWFKNENQMSWIDEKPYVTCPDPFTVVDSNTGLGLSNFRPEWWTIGREVTLWGMKCADFWRTERGLRIYNPKHFGFDMKYVPIEEMI